MLVLNAMFCAALALSSLFQAPGGYEWNKKSTLTTDRAVEFPGIVLEPGTYVVRLLQGGETRSSIQILNQDESKVLATVVSVPDHRVRPEDNSEFTFHAVKGEGPQPVQSWFFYGDLVGQEFVYPKTRAKEIARESDSHVMASNSKDAVVFAITPNGKEVVIDDPVTQTARRKPQ